MNRRLVAMMLAVLALDARGTHGQSFESASSRVEGGGFEMIEHAITLRRSAWLETAWVGRHGLAELSSRAAAVSGRVGPWSGALGISQTGDPDIGWAALGFAAGFSGDHAGAALRAVARRDHLGFASVLGEGTGLEAGGGAWVTAGHSVRLWAQAPQLWTRGVPPPLERALTLGATWRAAGLELWLARSSPSHPWRHDGDHEAGVAIVSPSWRVWLEARNHPLRSAIGLAATAAGVRIAAEVESHPVLNETVRLTLGFFASRRP